MPLISMAIPVSCDFTVTVTDDEDPTFINCPEGVIFTVGLFSDDCLGGAIWSIPVADDNCGATVEQTAGPSQGEILGVGTYPIQYTATDDAGNTATCNFTIEVIDTEDPVIVCPGNVVIDETDEGVQLDLSSRQPDPAFGGEQLSGHDHLGSCKSRRLCSQREQRCERLRL